MKECERIFCIVNQNLKREHMNTNVVYMYESSSTRCSTYIACILSWLKEGFDSHHLKSVSIHMYHNHTLNSF